MIASRALGVLTAIAALPVIAGCALPERFVSEDRPAPSAASKQSSNHSDTIPRPWIETYVTPRATYTDASSDPIAPAVWAEIAPAKVSAGFATASFTTTGDGTSGLASLEASALTPVSDPVTDTVFAPVSKPVALPAPMRPSRVSTPAKALPPQQALSEAPQSISLLAAIPEIAAVETKQIQPSTGPAGSGALDQPGTRAKQGAKPDALAFQQSPNIDLSPGQRTFPLDEGSPAFTIDDELILQLRITGITATDTIIAYGTAEGIYLPVGELARILDLAVKVSDDGHYANGWFLSEDRTVTIDLRQRLLTTSGGSRPLMPSEAQAFEGELFLLSDVFSQVFPLSLEPNLRTQSVLLTTLEPFPFEERMKREAERAKLNSRSGKGEGEKWERQETPWLAVSVPIADVELRAVSDSPLGERFEGDVRLAGDLAFMTGQAFVSATTRDGLVASLIQVGRRDPDADLLGPLGATDFQFGDVATTSTPVGLRGRAGRGGFISNRPIESASVFEQIDLRGILPNGYEVELYRNGVLVGSIATAVNGQYEFLEVPVDYGLNVFRLVFFGPQGQRREEVRRITVGDGRLAKGDLEYEVGVIQRDVNLLEVVGPNFNPTEGFGNWQGAAQLSYGVTSDITAISSVSYFENDGANDVIGTTGIRTGIGTLAVRADAAVSDKGGFALGVGTGGRALGGSFTLSHFEYGGGFVDEIRSNSRDMLQRATEFDFNTNLNFGSELKRKSVPIAARLRHIEFADGRTDTDAVLRGSYRLPGMIVSNTLEYSRDTALDGSDFSQLIGNFDLATFRRSRTQIRGSVGYTVTQGPDITNVEAGVDYQFDDKTVVSGQAGYSFNGGGLNVGASAIREFDRFSLALDGNYGFEQQNYSVALRLGFSFGRDPLRRRFFFDRPGHASSGAASVRAFQDMNGDRVFNTGDVPLDGVDFIVSNNTFTTDQDGMARLTQIGNGNRASIQVDPSTFPDILMAPVERGVEIVPRAGRFHVMDFPIVALSEVEGTVTFKGEEKDRGVSGLRLELIDASGKVAAKVRSERDGYFFFEQIKPGAYTLRIEPKQAQRLGICMASDPVVNVEPQGGIYSVDTLVVACEGKD